MKNKLWITVGLIAALMTAGCAGQGAKPAADAGTEQAEQEAAADQAEQEATTDQTEAEDETGAAADQAETEAITEDGAAQAEAGQEETGQAQEQASEADTAANETAAEADTAADEAAAETASAAVDYSDGNNWVYFGIGEDKDVDLFIVCPTVDTLDEENMSLENEVMRKYFEGALNMERGIYEDSARMYAPYYRQAALNSYRQDETERERRLEIAYRDVSDAFAYYLEHENNGRPIILAGFCQCMVRLDIVIVFVVGSAHKEAEGVVVFSLAVESELLFVHRKAQLLADEVEQPLTAALTQLLVILVRTLN